MKIKHLIAVAGLLIAGVSNAATVTCGVYTLTGVGSSYTCEAFNTSPVGTAASVGGAHSAGTTITHNGASVLLTYAGIAQGGANFPLLSGLETFGGAGTGSVSAGLSLTPTLDYLVLLFDTPLNGSQPWMIFSATGADLLAPITINESTGTGTFKYRLYDNTLTPNTSVPLPGTALLLGLGALMLGAARKYKA